MSCTNSYSVSLAECPDYIKVWAGLTPNSSYAWLITDKHGNEYWEYVTTDADGAFLIDCAGVIFPNGLFNYAAGRFKIEVFSVFPYVYIGEEGANLTFCGATYDSIVMWFTKRSSTQENSIQHIKCV